MDWAPNFYAAAGYNGLPVDTHVHIGWMNNWQYGQNIPTDPWRSAMSIPWHLALETIGDKATLHTYKSVPEGSINVGNTGETIKIDLSFSAASTASEFAITIQASADSTEQTFVSYDFINKQVFIDRTKSGDVSLDKSFASVYRGPLAPGDTGEVRLSILARSVQRRSFRRQGRDHPDGSDFPEQRRHLRLVGVDWGSY